MRRLLLTKNRIIIDWIAPCKLIFDAHYLLNNVWFWSAIAQRVKTDRIRSDSTHTVYYSVFFIGFGNGADVDSDAETDDAGSETDNDVRIVRA